MSLLTSVAQGRLDLFARECWHDSCSASAEAMGDSNPRSRRDVTRWLAVDAAFLTVLLAALLAWPLRTPPIYERGEAREGLVVQDIVASHRRVLPTAGAIWLTMLLFFTLAAGKRGIYLLPLYPAVALLAARSLARHIAAAQDVTPAVATPRLAWQAWPPRLRLRRVAVTIVALDLTLLLASQLARSIRAERKSLSSFASVVRQIVPPDTALTADPGLDTDVIVLAYMLSRPLPIQANSSADAIYRLAPATATGRLCAEGWTVVALSQRREDNVALMRRGGLR